MGELQADWRLRLRRGDASGPVCGAGVLIDPDLVMTCAHVVTDRNDVMWVEFAENREIEPVAARVAKDGWLPGPDGQGEDVALLRLESPRPQARPATLEPQMWAGLPVYATGYAKGFEDGMALHGTIGGMSGEWVQVDSVHRRGVVRRGFSGAAVCTMPDDQNPPRVVGLIVSWRGDRGMPLPEDNVLAFSYLIPIERIAELSPGVKELIGPGAWNQGFEDRLGTWFEDPHEDPVKITVVPPGSGKDRALRFLLNRAELRYQGGRSSRPALADRALDYIAYTPGREYLAYWDWLLGTGRSPGAVRLREPEPPVAAVDGMDQKPKPLRPVVAVDGMDQEADPRPLIELLDRLRRVGFRLLIVFRTEGGTGWTAARDVLLAPALEGHADLLLTDLNNFEVDHAVKIGVVSSGSLGSESLVVDLRRTERRAIDGISDPQERLKRLRELIKRLRMDLSFYRRAGLRSHGGRA
ncbi:S1 family peptidase [Streptomyces sp. NBC_00286]|uniref:S1 family peptidase n=1 Tax=Streptomyces sp. NBC_00286 TaxID=2975701 RepID=UPI002E290B88|nr:serine protease [Streptomyces sp. NBC_00286]